MSNISKRNYTKQEIINIFENCLNKTLGEIDTAGVFKKTKIHPKITGIAGMVIEESVLKYSPDSLQEPDILIDGKPTEVKTTGVKISKKNSNMYEAKEPMSITAVSPNKIIDEEFENSNFWHKLERLLIIYYHYNSDTTVKAINYQDFLLVGYQFKIFTQEEIEMLKSDWTIVRNFIKHLQLKYENYENEYPRISSELRDKLMLIDTAPKWPNPPRFRLKRSTVTNIVQEHFGKKLEQIPLKINSYKLLDEKLKDLTNKYSGKTIKEIINELNLSIKLSKTGDASKSIAEQIVVKMFGGKSKKISNIDIFNKIGLIGKTVTTTNKGKRTEDMKLFTIDFDEWTNLDKTFEESDAYAYFSQNQLLCIIFKESCDNNKPINNNKLIDNIFLGFKRISFDDDFLYNILKPIWLKIRELILTGTLKETIILDKNNKPIINNNGIIRTTLNFPKSKDSVVFVRGTGSDSKDKPLLINGIRMYNQNLWLKGSYIVDILDKKIFI